MSDAVREGLLLFVMFVGGFLVGVFTVLLVLSRPDDDNHHDKQ